MLLFIVSCMNVYDFLNKVAKLIRKGKEIDCSLWYWKMVFFIWNLFFPIRKELLWLLRKISQLKNI